MNTITEIKKAEKLEAKETAKKQEVSKSPLQGAEGVSGSVALLEILVAENADIIFGYPGGAIMPVYDALWDYKKKLNRIAQMN